MNSFRREYDSPRDGNIEVVGSILRTGNWESIHRRTGSRILAEAMVFVGVLVLASSAPLLLDCLNEFEKEFGNSGKPF